jgi:hypothetical protein
MDFVPLPGPGVLPPGAKRVRYVLVAQEPSARTAFETRRSAKRWIAQGARNFWGQPNDLALQWAVERWLVRGSSDGYVLTDLAKCRVRTDLARGTCDTRYANCAPWLEREIEVTHPAAIIAVGRTVERHLRRVRRREWPPIYGIGHHSRRRRVAASRKALKWIPSKRTLQRWFDERLGALPYTTRSGKPYKASESTRSILAAWRREIKPLWARVRRSERKHER